MKADGRAREVSVGKAAARQESGARQRREAAEDGLP